MKIDYLKICDFKYSGTPNKGQLIFRENESNKGNLGIPLFVIFYEVMPNKGYFEVPACTHVIFHCKSV